MDRGNSLYLSLVCANYQIFIRHGLVLLQCSSRASTAGFEKLF